MPFPEADRIIYNKNPLEEVICQLRFPPILSIDKEIPSQFQNVIRSMFPEFQEKVEAFLPISSNINKELPPEIIRQMMPSQTKTYKFTSEDDNWMISMTRTFLSLTTRNYEKWEEFKSRLETPFNALIEIYKPSYFTRIGLRYIDVIRRSDLHLENVSWNELINTSVLGLLGSSEIRNEINAIDAKYLIDLGEGDSKVRISLSLVDWTKPNNEVEECFKIDSDFYEMSKTEIANAMGKLEYYHIQASRLIQWLITPRLHDAMEPQSL